jgi:ubiquinone/menaquinone biosynthesis C-methylase UbiE
MIMFIFKLLPRGIFSTQARKPTGLIGRYVMTKIFSKGNADINAFVKELLELKGNDRVLEIGFGPGKLISEMAKVVTDGVVEGIDFSEAMLKEASKVNRHHILRDRVKLQKGDCSTLPYGNDSFDKLCSVNTLYFWKKPGKNLREIFRVVKPKGKVVIGFRDENQMNNLNLSAEIFTTYSLDDVANLLSDTGFSDVHIKKKEGKPFHSYCAVATKA